jgi:hypothetical protein
VVAALVPRPVEDLPELQDQGLAPEDLRQGVHESVAVFLGELSANWQSR